MTLLFPFLLLAAVPFWEGKPPTDWSDQELQALLTDSPWAQVVSGPGTAAPAVQVFLATASPMEQAERESERRAKLRAKPGAGAKESPEPEAEDSAAAEYREWLEQNRATHVVLAIRIPRSNAFSDEREVRRLEDESLMHIGRRKFKLSGHFPPSAGDPVLRLAFPREVQLSDKSVSFDLYLPGVAVPYRVVEFRVKDLLVRGKVEM